MAIEQLLTRGVLSLPPTASCVDAARAMRDGGVGSVVVAEGDEPRGIVTDRDLAVRIIAEGQDPAGVVLREVMTAAVCYLEQLRDVDGAIEAMRSVGVRRLPVVDSDGKLVGVLSFDDLLSRVGRQVGALADVVAHAVERPDR